MSKPAIMTAKAAARTICPGTTKIVHVLFVTGTARTAFVRVPKVCAKNMLRDLGEALVDLELRGDEAFIRGARR